MKLIKTIDKYFNDNKFKELKIPAIIQDAIDVVDNTTPYRMKLFIALHEMVVLASSTGGKIVLDSKTNVAINSFAIMLSSSGSEKDKTVNSIKACLKPAYKHIETDLATKALALAKATSKRETGSEAKHAKYYKRPNLTGTVSTEEGFTRQLSILDELKGGALSITISELVSELKGSKDMAGLLKQLAIVYDLGLLGSKLLKDEVNTTPAIESVNANLLAFSSAATLIADSVTKDKFVDILVTMFGRRSLLLMNDEVVNEDSDEDLIDYLNNAIKADSKNSKAKEVLSIKAERVVMLAIRRESNDVTLPAVQDIRSTEDIDARNAFRMYKIYNSYRAKMIGETNVLLQLRVKNLQWVALKFAGAFAILDERSVITLSDFMQAVSIVEFFADDIAKFSVEMDKEQYEHLINRMQKLATHNTRAYLTKHKLVKEGYIRSNASEKAINDLVTLCQSADNKGTYSYTAGKFRYEKHDVVVPEPKVVAEITTVTTTPTVVPQKVEAKVVEKEVVPVVKSDVIADGKIPYVAAVKSFTAFKFVYQGNEYTNNTTGFGMSAMEGNGYLDHLQPDAVKYASLFTNMTAVQAKDMKKKVSAKGFHNVTLKNLSDFAMLASNETSYAAYHFNQGHRTLENLVRKSNVLLIDVDDTKFSIQDMHSILADYRHVLSTTSDKTNMFKYRIIIELDSFIELNNIQWKIFYGSVCNMLHIDYDENINQAGFMIGYDDSLILKNEGKLLPASSHVERALSDAVEPEKIVQLTDQDDLDAAFDEREDTYAYWYDNPAMSQRSLKLYSLMRKLCAVGFDREMVVEILEEVNDGLDFPLPTNRMRDTLLKQIPRFAVK